MKLWEGCDMAEMTLEEMKQRLKEISVKEAQLKNLYHDEEAKLRDLERRARTRTLIQIGGEFVRVFGFADVQAARQLFEAQASFFKK